MQVVVIVFVVVVVVVVVVVAKPNPKRGKSNLVTQTARNAEFSTLNY